MRLHTIREGIFFGDTSGLSPKGLEAARKRAAAGKGQHGGSRGSGGLVDLFMNRPYHYREEDSPEDIVHLNPLNSVTQLPVLPDSKDARATFRGAKIYYAFAVVPKTSYNGAEVEKAYPTPRVTGEQVVTIGKLMRKVWDGADNFTQEDVEDVLGDLDEVYLRDYSFAEHRGTLRQLKTLLPDLLDAMKKMKAPTVKKLRTILTTPNANTREQFAGEILNYAKESLAKKIKRPTDPGEMEMSRQVLERSTNNFVRLFPNPFDFIVVPESSSDFNGKLIALLKAKGGADTPVVTLNKVIGRDVNIDIRSLYEKAWQYHDEAKQSGKFNDKLIFTPDRIDAAKQATRSMNAASLPEVAPGETLTPMDPRWADYWVQSKVGQLDSQLSAHLSKKPAVKSMQNIDRLKQYMQLYSGEGLGGVKGKRVLVVDDNVDNSATMQMVHALVKERGAGEVVIFTPFYMGG